MDYPACGIMGMQRKGSKIVLTAKVGLSHHAQGIQFIKYRTLKVFSTEAGWTIAMCWKCSRTVGGEDIDV